MKKIPMRKCLATNESLPKNDLLRIVKTPEGEIKPDITGKINGKGAYIKKTMEALSVLKEKKLLERAFETKINDSVYKEIADIIDK